MSLPFTLSNIFNKPVIFVNDSFERLQVSSPKMDNLWSQGWRHFGTYFFRYSLAFHRSRFCTVMPLRIDLQRFTLSRSQKRTLAKNRDVALIIRDTKIDWEKKRLFYQHRDRFTENVPDSLYDFISGSPDIPCRNVEICCYSSDKLLAASFLDIGETATSAVYAMFDLAESKRSLGIYTMLEAIRYSIEIGCRYYYPGYAYFEPSVYDYKKNFSGLEYLDWQNGWTTLNKRAEED